MIRVAVGIILQEGNASSEPQVLLCQRKSSVPYALKWEFPGGKVEKQEDIEECLRRELKEELGINIMPGELLHRQQNVYPDSGTFDVCYYLVSTYSGTITNRAFECCRWIPITELQEYNILEGNRAVIQKLLRKYGKNISKKS